MCIFHKITFKQLHIPQINLNTAYILLDISRAKISNKYIYHISIRINDGMCLKRITYVDNKVLQTCTGRTADVVTTHTAAICFTC